MDQLFETAPTLTGRFAEVAPERGVDAAVTGLTYAVPESLADLAVGERVLIPLGRQDKPTPGIVIKLAGQTQLSRVKAILGRDRAGVALTGDLVELAVWMAGYYCCPIGMVVQTMLPAAVKRATGLVRQAVVDLKTLPPPELPSPPELPPPPEIPAEPSPKCRTGKVKKMTALQRAVLAAARELAGAGQVTVSLRELADAAGARSVAPVQQLAAKGLLVLREESVVRADPLAEALAAAQREGGRIEEKGLMAAQRRAIAHLVETLGAAGTARADTGTGASGGGGASGGAGASGGGGFSVHLLHGVTGSGKTEVYLRVIEHVRATNAPSKIENQKSTFDLPGVIVLVPEIALTPQTVARFLGRFGPRNVAVLHSGLTAAQRHDQWQRIRRGEASIVVGARSAVFAPLANLKLIIVDEEQEPSYKQDQLPRYQARDVAVKRAQLAGAAVLLGSATPSLESYYNATHVPGDPAGQIRAQEEDRAGAEKQKAESRKQKPSPPPPEWPPELPPDSPPDSSADSPRKVPAKAPRYHLLTLPQRVAGLTLPAVTVVDMSQERRKRYQYTGSAGIHLLSLQLEAALRRTLEAGGQALLLLNRRGFANYISCPDHRCGWLLQCEFCDVLMVYHKSTALPHGGVVRCHHCQAEQMLPQVCPVCGKKIVIFGLGTQRVEEEMARKFPGAKLARMDADTMRTARDYHATLEEFRAGRVDVLLGTQMIAKGLDYPNVRLVGVISADTALNLPDFRSAERTFQLIAQVAGRAGRGEHPGTVYVQTFNPQDPAIQLAAQHDYEAFAQREIGLRAQVGLPPVTRLARIVVRDQDHLKAQAAGRKLADLLEEANEALGSPVRLRGPAAAPIARIGGYHRLQIELIAPDAGTLQRLLGSLRERHLLKSDAHTAVDVDPVSLL